MPHEYPARSKNASEFSDDDAVVARVGEKAE
jgi:hypothetical protein